MPYIINRYNGTELTVLEDGTINTSTSLGLIGRNYFGYGEQQNENFVYLLENFANSNPPLNPIKGQTWFDTDSYQLKIFDGELWLVIGSAAVSNSSPQSFNLGSLWLKTPENVLYIYNGTEWSFIGPENVPGFGVTKAESTKILDSTNVQRPVILFKVNDIVVAIISSFNFTINNNNIIPGFSNIVAGITMSLALKYKGNLEGIADKALQLENIRLINGIAFDGTSNITIKASTTNKLVPGEYINGDEFDGSSPVTWNVNATHVNQPNSVVSRNPNGDFTARRITADLVGNVQGNVTSTEGISFFNICRANKFEAEELVGNAETANRLRNPKRINGVLFSGLEDIIVSSSAQTLTGSFMSTNVTTSNLQQLGTLRFLSVEDQGISIGNSAQKLKLTSTLAGHQIFSETGSLKIGSVGGTVNVDGNLNINGDFIVTGTITTVNSTDVYIKDKIITIASGSINSQAANGAGIEIAGAGASLFYTHLGNKWNINKPLDAGANDISTLGLFRGTATAARYADLAENYLADQMYEPANVLEFGGEKEITLASENSRRVAGVVSENPALLMNSECQGQFVVPLALQGRVKCKVRGNISRGDMLVSAGDGYAKADPDPKLGMIIGKSLEDFFGDTGFIEIVVGRI